MMPINRPVRIVTKDGRTITGRRLNEDTYTVQLIDDRSGCIRSPRATSASYDRRDEVADAVVRDDADGRRDRRRRRVSADAEGI